MEGHVSTSQSPQWAVVPMEEEEEFPQGKKFYLSLLIEKRLYISSEK